MNFRLQKTKVIGKEPSEKEKTKTIEITNPSSYVLWEKVDKESGVSGSFVEIPIAVDYQVQVTEKIFYSFEDYLKEVGSLLSLVLFIILGLFGVLGSIFIVLFIS